jgi:hypothetical protein
VRVGAAVPAQLDAAHGRDNAERRYHRTCQHPVAVEPAARLVLPQGRVLDEEASHAEGKIGVHETAEVAFGAVDGRFAGFYRDLTEVHK